MFRAGVVALAAAALTGVAAASAAGAPAKTIATARSVDVRVDVTAELSSGGAAPTAKVMLTTYTWAHARWQRAGRTELHGTFFWNTVTAPHAICRLELSTGGARGSRPHATVQLLLSPSIGCGKPQTVPLP